MRVVIFAGGTGSIALQCGLHRALEGTIDGVDTKIIVNAYDSGLSTGAVRRVMGGKILGPSDVRKNHATRLALQDPHSPWLAFLNSRFTARSASARELLYAKTALLFDEVESRNGQTEGRSTFLAAMDEYFDAPLAATIEYNDFSFPNIIYAGIARAHHNSLRAAARIMAGIMGIPDNVLLNDDTPLYLGGITQSGQKIFDEGDIVSWGNDADPFVDLFFTDSDGRDGWPQLCLEAWRAILEADLIILSSGTQWSSLIPTYASDGFKAAVNRSNAKLLMVMNRSPDRDSPGQLASEIIDILVPRFFDADRLHVIADVNGHPGMGRVSHSALGKLASFNLQDVSTARDAGDKHDPTKLVRAIAHVYFAECLDSEFFLFDYDDTLVDRRRTLKKSSDFNVRGISHLNRLTNVGICTGNTISAIDLRCTPASPSDSSESPCKPVLVFADGGVNVYSYDTRSLVHGAPTPCSPGECVCASAELQADGPYSATEIAGRLQRAGLLASMIDIRGNITIAIKPVPREYREAVLRLAQHVVQGSDLEVRECGQTTVEICRPALSKTHALRYLRAGHPAIKRFTYVGDEFESGNDKDLDSLARLDPGVRCLHVSGPAKTAFFIETLIAHLTKHDEH